MLNLPNQLNLANSLNLPNASGYTEGSLLVMQYVVPHYVIYLKFTPVFFDVFNGYSLVQLKKQIG